MPTLDTLDTALRALAAAIDDPPDGDDNDWKRAMRLQDAMADVRAGQRRPVLRADMEADYNARIAGSRPLNAPPLES